MGLSDILSLEGIVIRLIPKESTSLWSYREGDEHKLKDNQSIVVKDNGRKFIKEIKKNALGGLYIITFKDDQDSTVMFNKKYDGIGNTIEAAYNDYRTKFMIG